jgi:hypothetical protein
MGTTRNVSGIGFSHILWAATWGILFTYVFVRTLHSDRCFHILSGRRFEWTVVAFAAVWFVVFFITSNRGRVVLVLCSLSGYLVLPPVTRAPFASAEANLITTLGQLSQSVETYRREHQNEGYPSTLPGLPSGNYSLQQSFQFRYLTSRSKPDGPIDGFLIQVTPVWRQCGFIRSFTATDNDQIFFTLEDRPATTADQRLR